MRLPWSLKSKRGHKSRSQQKRDKKWQREWQRKQKEMGNPIYNERNDT